MIIVVVVTPPRPKHAHALEIAALSEHVGVTCPLAGSLSNVVRVTSVVAPTATKLKLTAGAEDRDAHGHIPASEEGSEYF